MKTTIKVQANSTSSQKYSSLETFVASKLKDATESLKKVDLSILKK